MGRIKFNINPITTQPQKRSYSLCVCVTHQHRDRGSRCTAQVQWVVQLVWLRQSTDTKLTTFIQVQVIQVQAWLIALVCPNLWWLAAEWWLSACPSSFPSCQFWAFWWPWGPLALCSSSCPSSSFCLPQVLSSICAKALKTSDRPIRSQFANQ